MAMPNARAAHPPTLDIAKLLASRWLWCLVAVLFLAGRDLAQGFSDLLVSLGDTDDATRLYQVRHLMATGAWFDMTLPRLGGDTPLVSHWSRLIDLPLVLLLQAFGSVMTPAHAELTTRIVWPLLVLFAFFVVLVRAAHNQSGATAAAFTLVLGLTCLSGLFQFRIGRIDHHNVMIMGSIGGLLILLHARVAPREGYLAGGLIGIALAVGYEPLAFLLPALAAAALVAVYDRRWLHGIRNMAAALTATLALAFVATVPPSLWVSIRCDALSLNMLVLVASGGAGLSLIAGRARDATVTQRIGILGGFGGIGLLAYGALDTRCLAGPFGQVDPAVNAIWLDQVSETMSVFRFFHTSPEAALAFAATVAIGIFAAATRWRRTRTPEAAALLVLLVIVAPTGFWMIKLLPYASWVALFCTALAIADLEQTPQATALSRRVIAALLASQLTFTALVGLLTRSFGHAQAASTDTLLAVTPECLSTPAIRSLAALPKGRFVGAIDFGSYIVALTPHAALAAPYHRIDRAIVANQAILAAPPQVARRLLQSIHADYVVACVPKAATVEVQLGAGLEQQLKTGQIIAFLQPIEFAGPAPELRVWRVLR